MINKSSNTLSSSSTPIQITVPALLQFLDISPDAIIVINQAGTIVRANKHTHALFRYTHEELLGLSIDMLLPERFRMAHMTHRELFFSVPLTRFMGIGLQLFGQRKDGTEFPVDVSLKPLLVDDTLHTISTVYDITQYAALVEAEKLARTEALERANQLETIFNTITDGLLVYNRQEHIIHSNKAARQILKIETYLPSFYNSSSAFRATMFRPRDKQGQPFIPECLPVHRLLNGETLANRHVVEVNLLTAHEQEIQISVSGAPLYNQQGEVSGAVCVLHDLTERKHMERRLEILDALIEIVETLVHSSALDEPSPTSEKPEQITLLIGLKVIELIRRLLGCSHTMIISIEPHAHILSPLAITGFSPEQEQHFRSLFTDVHLSALIDDPHQLTLLEKLGSVPLDLAQSPLMQHLFPGSPSPYCLLIPIHIAHRLIGLLSIVFPGQTYALDAEDSLLINAMSKLCALALEYGQQAMERLKFMEARQHLNKELERLNTMQSNFISVIDHEFRTALTSIEGFSSLLRDEIYDNEDVKDYANDIYTDALRLHSMITNLLDLEQMKQGKIQIQPKWIDINALVSQITGRMDGATTSHTFHLHLDQRNPHLEADMDKLIQVITNLLSNAVKYSPNGGEIIIATLLENASVHLSIQDYGIGIADTVVKDVFMPYHHIDTKLTRHIQGTGLGLPIVKEIVEMHQGRIWVESILGQGSLFHLIFPLRFRNLSP